MSIHWRILGAFLLIILLMVVIGAVFDYMAGIEELSDFSAKIRTEDLANVLSREYTQDKGWENLDSNLKRHTVWIDPEKLADKEKEEIKLFEAPWRVVVRDVNGVVLADTNKGLEQVPVSMEVEGERAIIQDLETGETVGTLIIAINRDYLKIESRKFLGSILMPRLLQGLFTAVIAMLIGVWMSRRITAPVVALKDATQAIVQSGDTQLLPVNSSDELGQMSASFNQMILSLQTQRELRKRLIDDIAHELNTPLSVIRLEAKGLQDSIKPPDQAADQIIGEVDLLKNLVYDLNWLAETDSGDLRFEMELHNYGKFLKDEVARWQLQAQAAEINLVLQPLPLDLPAITMDAIRISQALGNLIENALRNTLKGGQIIIQCRMKLDGLITSVCDTGHGIPSEDLPHIFERFYSTDISQHKGGGGHGLGLAIVKHIIETHQGDVWVESKPEIGSCFHFCLPV
jgi:signal transduction histidine kinase